MLANDFICLLVASMAMHMSIAFWVVKSVSFSNLQWVLSHWILQTILSWIKPSLRSWNSQVCAFLLKSVTYSSMVWSSHWLRVLNMCLSHVTFVWGMQWPLHFTRTISTFCLLSSLVQVNVLYTSKSAGLITCRSVADCILASYVLSPLASVNSSNAVSTVTTYQWHYCCLGPVVLVEITIPFWHNVLFAFF